MKLRVTSCLVLAAGAWVGSTIYAQELDTNTTGTAHQALIIPHKARLSGPAVVGAAADQRNGQADLIFRVYSQRTGGVKLFEERQTVKVQHGVVEAAIGSVTPGGIPADIMSAHGTLWVETVNATDFNEAATAPRAKYMFFHDGNSPQAISLNVDSSLCWTCGGAYPILSGVIPLPSGSYPLERGSACGGGLVYAADTSPRLCSR